MKTFAICLMTLLLSVSAHAQVAGDLCKLGDTTKLFSGKAGKKFSAKLSKGTSVTLKAAHGARWLVEGRDGKRGYIKTKWLKKACKFSKPKPVAQPVAKPEPAPAPEPEPAVEPVVAPEVVVPEEEPQAEDPLDAMQLVPLQPAPIECAPKSANAHRVGVYTVQVTNLPNGMRYVVTDGLLAEIRKLEGISAVGMPKPKGGLQPTSNVPTGDDDVAFWAKLACKLGVDEIATGRMLEGPDGRELAIWRIKADGQPLGEPVSQKLGIGLGEEFLTALGPGVEKLYPNRQIRPGTERGASSRLMNRMNPPPLDATMTLSTMAAAVVSLGLGGTFAYLAGEKEALYNGGAGLEPGAVDAAAFRDIQATGDQYFALGNAGIIMGVTMAVSSVAMSFFTDWEAFMDEDSEDL